MNQIYKSNNIRVLHDETSELLSIEWKGIVDIEEFKNGMEALLNQSSQIPKCKVIFNFEHMLEITTEARIWFQDYFLKDRGFDFLSKTDKLAFIMPYGIMPRFIVESLQELCLNTCPKLNSESFGNVKEASDWINSNSESPNPVTMSHSVVFARSFKQQ